MNTKNSTAATAEEKSFIFKTNHSMFKKDKILLDSLWTAFKNKNEAKMISCLKMVSANFGSQKKRQMSIDGIFCSDAKSLPLPGKRVLSSTRLGLPSPSTDYSKEEGSPTRDSLKKRKREMIGLHATHEKDELAHVPSYLLTAENWQKYALMCRINGLDINGVELSHEDDDDEGHKIIKICSSCDKETRALLYEFGLVNVIFSKGPDDLVGLPAILVNTIRNLQGSLWKDCEEISIITYCTPPEWLKEDYGRIVYKQGYKLIIIYPWKILYLDTPRHYPGYESIQCDRARGIREICHQAEAPLTVLAEGRRTIICQKNISMPLKNSISSSQFYQNLVLQKEWETSLETCKMLQFLEKEDNDWKKREDALQQYHHQSH